MLGAYIATLAKQIYIYIASLTYSQQWFFLAKILKTNKNAKCIYRTTLTKTYLKIYISDLTGKMLDLQSTMIFLGKNIENQ